VLFVGRLNAQKGAADLLRVADTFPAGTTLDIVGDGPDRAALEAEARGRGLEGRMRWHGQLPQSAIVSLYRQASVVAMPSREEGLGLVAVEALLTGTPVVAYRSGGVAELIEDGITGILVETGNANALGGSINALIADPARARRMGAEGRSRMVERFSPAAAAATYAAIYSRVTRA
jgi:glycosyltransferase involved in cell wall biosynthesis